MLSFCACLLASTDIFYIELVKVKATFKSNYPALFSLVTCVQSTEHTKINKLGEKDNRFGECSDDCCAILTFARPDTKISKSSEMRMILPLPSH